MKRKKAIFIIFIIFFTLEVFSQNDLGKTFNKCFEISRKTDEEIIFASDNDNTNILSFLNFSITSKNVQSKDYNWTANFVGKLKKPGIIINNDILFITDSLPSESLSIQKSLLNSINLKTGLPEWQKEIENNSEILGSSIDHQLILKNGLTSIQTVNLKSGETILSANITADSFPLFIFKKDRLFILEEDATNSVFFGKELTIEILPNIEKPTAIGEFNETQIIYGTSTGKIVSFAYNSNHINWKFQSGAKISDIFVIKNTIIAISFDNFIYCLSANNGKLKWKQRVNSRVDIKPIIRDKFIIIGSSSEKSIRIYDTKKGKLVNFINIASYDGELLENFLFPGKYFVALTNEKSVWFSNEECD